MKNNDRKEARSSARIPAYWTSSKDSRGETTLTYAVRGGMAQVMLAILGATAVSCGIYFTVYIIGGGGVTIAGIVVTIVIGGPLLAFGAHCLDIVFLARTEYLLRRADFIACHSSMWGKKRTEIQRSAITGVAQHYSPPGKSSPTGAPGTWTTFIVSRKKVGKGIDEFPLDGQGSVEEARWLGPLLAEWAEAPITRGFGGGFEEADEKELPSLDE
jgi:hypothetical protein